MCGRVLGCISTSTRPNSANNSSAATSLGFSRVFPMDCAISARVCQPPPRPRNVPNIASKRPVVLIAFICFMPQELLIHNVYVDIVLIACQAGFLYNFLFKFLGVG